MEGCRLAQVCLLAIAKEERVRGIEGYVKMLCTIEVAHKQCFSKSLCVCMGAGQLALAFGGIGSLPSPGSPSPHALLRQQPQLSPSGQVNAKQRPRYAARLTNPSPHVMFAPKERWSLAANGVDTIEFLAEGVFL